MTKTAMKISHPKAPARWAPSEANQGRPGWATGVRAAVTRSGVATTRQATVTAQAASVSTGSAAARVGALPPRAVRTRASINRTNGPVSDPVQTPSPAMSPGALPSSVNGTERGTPIRGKSTQAPSRPASGGAMSWNVMVCSSSAGPAHAGATADRIATKHSRPTAREAPLGPQPYTAGQYRFCSPLSRVLAPLTLLICAQGAAAADYDIQATATAAEDSHALRLVVEPAEGFEGDFLIAVVGNEGVAVSLTDDGTGSDRVAGDGAFVGVLAEELTGGGTTISIVGPDTRELFNDTLPIDGGLVDRWIALTFEGLRPKVHVGGTPPRHAEGPVPGLGEGSSATLGGTASGGAVQWIVALMTAVVGLIVGFVLRRPRKIRLPARPVSPRRRANGGLATAPAAELEALVSTRAAEGFVLLVPQAAHRDRWRRLGEGRPVVRWLTTDRPTAKQVVAAQRKLLVLGPGVVIIDGHEALEETNHDEADDAVVEEVVDRSETEVLLILPPAEPAEPTG